jgi:hypothetical protein
MVILLGLICIALGVVCCAASAAYRRIPDFAPSRPIEEESWEWRANYSRSISELSSPWRNPRNFVRATSERVVVERSYC